MKTARPKQSTRKVTKRVHREPLRSLLGTHIGWRNIVSFETYQNGRLVGTKKTVQVTKFK